MSRRQVAIAVAVMFILALSVSVSAVTRTVVIRVQGMTCGVCATSVEDALKSTDGVEQARVSYKTGKAVIKYDDQKVTIARLREVINSTGFFCEVEGPPGKRTQ